MNKIEEDCDGAVTQRSIRPLTSQYVVCAAIKCGDLIIAGARHFDSVMIRQLKAIENKDGTGVDWKH